MTSFSAAKAAHASLHGPGGLADLSGYFASTPAATELTVFVSTGAKASDANSGLTTGAPKATIAGALAVLGGNAGLIQLGRGTYTISAADSSGNGVTLAYPGQRIRGLGPSGVTTIALNANLTWGIKCQAMMCGVEDVMITVATGKTVTYVTGCSPPATPGSMQHCKFNNVWIASSGTVTAAFALGPDFPGSGNIDIANTKFRDCAYNGTGITHGWLSGNGTTGNVTANEAYGCRGVGSTYGITLDGSGFNWFGGGFASITGADIHLMHGGQDGSTFVGMRSENGNQAVNTIYGGNYSGGLKLIGCTFGAYNPTDGVTLIDYSMTGPLYLSGGFYSTVGGATVFAINNSSGLPARALIAIGVTCDNANPYPPASVKVVRTIIAAQSVVAGVTGSNTAFTSVIDGVTGPTQKTQVITAVGAGTFTVPAGVTTLRILAVGGGGGGSGGGAAALTGGVATQAAGAGGAAGCPVDQTLTVTPGQVFTHSIGAAQAGGIGGVASVGATGNGGGLGTMGLTTIITSPGGGGVGIQAFGGGGGSNSLANSATSAGGGLSGLSSLYSSAGSYGQPGAGGYSITSARRCSPGWPGGACGGQAGEFAGAALGGLGGAAGLLASQWAVAGGSTGSAGTSSGTNGASAAANSGAGGGGGGGGAPGGAGGNGGNGGTGSVTYIWTA